MHLNMLMSVWILDATSSVLPKNGSVYDNAGRPTWHGPPTTTSIEGNSQKIGDSKYHNLRCYSTRGGLPKIGSIIESRRLKFQPLSRIPQITCVLIWVQRDLQTMDMTKSKPR